MAYQLADTVNKDKMFLVRRSDLEGRLDPDYVRYLRKKQSFVFPAIPLGKILKSYPQYGANEPGVSRVDVWQPRYVRITDIDEFGILSHELGATAVNIEDKYILVEDDLLLARSGNTVGKAYLHSPRSYPCFFAGYMIRFKINVEIALPSYVFTVTQLGLYKEWVNAVQRSAGQPNINAEEYRNYKLPLPPLDIQKQIVAKINAAYAAKQQKEAQARQLLDSIDTFLLNELGIELPPEEENSINQRMFIRKFSEVSGGRFDAMALQQRTENTRKAIRNGLFKSDKLKHVVAFNSEQVSEIGNRTYVGLENIQSNTGEYLLSDEKTSISSAGTFEQGDILFPKLRPYLNKVFLATFEGVCSTEFHVLQTLGLDSAFLSFFLRSKAILNQTNSLMTGNTLPRLQTADIHNLDIPLPPLEKQKEIATHIRTILDQAKQLRTEAVAGLELAKREVEAMILGGEVNS